VVAQTMELQALFGIVDALDQAAKYVQSPCCLLCRTGWLEP
jgi:hypothetical protein